MTARKLSFKKLWWFPLPIHPLGCMNVTFHSNPSSSCDISVQTEAAVYLTIAQTDIPEAMQLAWLLKGAKTSKAETILWSTPGSGVFLQAGLLQSNVTVTISALPKLTIHWHRCTRECLHGVAPLKGQCAHCCEVVKQNRDCSCSQTNRT